MASGYGLPMGLLRKSVVAGLTAKAIEIVRREAAKPENQRRAREMLARATSRGRRRRH